MRSLSCLGVIEFLLCVLFIGSPLFNLVLAILPWTTPQSDRLWVTVEWIYVTCFTYVVTHMSYRRRKLQPFKSNNYLMLFVSSLNGYILRSWVLLAEATMTNSTDALCNISRWIINLTYPGLTLPYLLRALRLYLVFRRYDGQYQPFRGRKGSTSMNYRSVSESRNKRHPSTWAGSYNNKDSLEESRNEDSLSHSRSRGGGGYYNKNSPNKKKVNYAVPGRVSTSKGNENKLEENHFRTFSKNSISAEEMERAVARSGSISQEFVNPQGLRAHARSDDFDMQGIGTAAHVGQAASLLVEGSPPRRDSVASNPSDEDDHYERQPTSPIGINGGDLDDDPRRKSSKVAYSGSDHGGDGSDRPVRYGSTNNYHTSSKSNAFSYSHSGRVHGGKIQAYRDKMFFWWFLVGLSPFFVLSIVEEFGNWNFSPSFFDCPGTGLDSTNVGIPSIVFHAVEALVLLSSLSFIWHVWDVFNMRGELAVVFVFDVAIAIVQILIVALDDSDYDTDFIRHLTSFRCGIFFLVSMFWPLHISLRSQTITTNMDAFTIDSLYSIEGILSNVVTYDVFAKFMENAGAEDLLSFYVKTNLYGDIEDDEERLEEAQELYQIYLTPPISPGVESKGPVDNPFVTSASTVSLGETKALSEYNYEAMDVSSVYALVPREIRNEIALHLHNVRERQTRQQTSPSIGGVESTPTQLSDGSSDDEAENGTDPAVSNVIGKDLFIKAQAVIVKILHREYLPSFKKTDAYRELYIQAAQHRAIQKRLKKSRMISPFDVV